VPAISFIANTDWKACLSVSLSFSLSVSLSFCVCLSLKRKVLSINKKRCYIAALQQWVKVLIRRFLYSRSLSQVKKDRKH
jgi:hypothetical protein